MKANNALRAIVGPTGSPFSFGIVWRGAEWLPNGEGYSGPFHTLQEASERACDIALHYAGAVPMIVQVPNVNRICRQCDGTVPEGCIVTCGASMCQEREAADNARRAAPKARKARR